jgi:hypothetical protein
MSQVDFNSDLLGGESLDEGGEEILVAPKKAVVYRKPAPNIYSLLLIISFILMLISTILLFLEVGRFDK